MNVTKEAKRDANEYARAQMFHGEGAGIRRKLIQATIESKAHKDPEYARVFYMQLGEQDMAEHAEKARAERKRIDRRASLSKNTKAVLTGNNKSMNTAVLVVATAAYLAHQTGYDKVVINKVKTKYNQFQARRKYKKTVSKDFRIVK